MQQLPKWADRCIVRLFPLTVGYEVVLESRDGRQADVVSEHGDLRDAEIERISWDMRIAKRNNRRDTRRNRLP